MNQARGPANPSRAGYTVIELLVTIGIILLLLSIIGVELPGRLFFGWFSYITAALPKVRYDWPRIGSAAVWVLLFTVGLHLFCRWLYSASAGPTGANPRWRFRWTATAVTLVLVTFAAGTAMVAFVHTISFMSSPNERLYAYVNRAAFVEDWPALAADVLDSGRRRGHSAGQVFVQHGRFGEPAPYWDISEIAHYAAVDGPDGVVGAVLICPRDPDLRAKHGIVVAVPDGTRIIRDATPAQVLHDLHLRATTFPTTRQ